MAKKAKKSKTVSSRPKTSPYAKSPTTVFFGTDRQRYYIQDTLLQQLKNCPIANSSTFDLVFEDVDADTAHTLIHFLYTGVYQTLDKTDDENAEAGEQGIVIEEFQKAVRVSEAANKYGLPALQLLAESEMGRRGLSMDLDDAIQAISKDSVAKYLDSSIWLQDYVSQKVRSAFQLNSEAFLGQDFFERIPSHTLTKVLAKIVVGLYSGLVLDLQTEKMAKEKASSSSHEGRASRGANGHPASDRSAPSAGTWPEYPENLALIDDPSIDSESRIPVNRTSSIPEVDAWNLPPKISDHADDADRAEALTLTLNDSITVHAKPGSVNNMLSSSGTREKELKLHQKVLPDSEAAVLQSSTELPANGTVEDEVEVTLDMRLAEAASGTAVDGTEKKQDDYDWGAFVFGTSSSKKKKKKKAPVHSSDTPVLATAEVPLEPECVVEYALAEAVPEPAVTAETEEISWGVEWGTTKKKKKKVEKEATLEAPPLEPEPAPDAEPTVLNAIVDGAEEDSWGVGWGATKKKKKKKGREATVEAPPLEPEPAPDAEPTVLDAIVDGADGPISTTQTTVVSESVDCPWRLGHLFGGYGWKTCKPCQAHVRSLAANLQAADL